MYKTPMPTAAVAAAMAAAILTAAPTNLAADTTVYNVTQLRNALNSATPGARIYMAGPGAGGSYTSRLWVSGVHGLPGNMIQVLALDPNDRPVFDVHADSAFTLSSSSYVLVDGIIAQGAGTATSSGNNIEFAFSHHMILKNSVSGDILHTGNSDGFKPTGSDNVLMYNCLVRDWGESGSGVDLVGLRECLFMRNELTFPGLPLYASANGIQPKGGSYQMGFYKNHFEDASSRAQQFGGSTGDAYWHQGNRAQGWEAYDMVAMGNTFHEGEAAVAYVSCTDCNLDYNTIVNPEVWVMRILKEGGDHQTAGNAFRRNLVHYGNISVQNIGPNTQPATFDYAENYWYKYTYPGGSIPALPGGETDPAGGTDPQLDGDYRPQYDGAKDYGAHAPAMEAAFEAYTSWFQWAWDQAQLFEPKADPNGPYEVGPGGSVTLDASGSYAGVGSYGPYSFDSLLWDLNRDGACDESGQSVQVTYDELTALGLGFGTHTIELKATVTNEYNTIWDLGFGLLTLVNHPALLGDANADNVVDGLDYNTWSLRYLESGHPAWADGGWSVGNFNTDDVVDGLDYNLWSLNYDPGPGAGESVPEPVTWLLLTLGASLLIRRR